MPESLNRSLVDALDSFRTEHGVPAVVGAIVEQDGRMESAAVGTRARNGAALATIDDQWHIGSCGKSMTAVLWACLVEAGLADWGVPVRSLFPDITVSERQWDEVTIDDVLRCTAGVASNPPRRQMPNLWESTLAIAEQRTNAVETILATPPKQPGRFRYSNLGYTLVGAAIDRVSGSTYEQALGDYVFEPLGMHSVGFGAPAQVRGHRSRFRLGPVAAGAGSAVEPGEVNSDNPPLLTPAGRMHLSIGDWATFQRLFLHGGRPLISAQSHEYILQIPADPKLPMAMGWVSGEGLGGSYGMQGSNTLWSATAVINSDMTRTALVVANDGRTKVLRRSATLAARLLALGN